MISKATALQEHSMLLPLMLTDMHKKKSRRRDERVQKLIYYKHLLLNIIPHWYVRGYHQPLLRWVGCAHRFPKPTVTRLCSAYVDMSILNGSEGSGGGAVLSGGGGATVVSLAASV